MEDESHKKRTEKMKVYVVIKTSVDSYSIKSIHKTYTGAFKAWDKVRIELLKRAKYFLNREKYGKEMWQKIVKNLSCKDPEKIDNGPHDSPRILELDVKE